MSLHLLDHLLTSHPFLFFPLYVLLLVTPIGEFSGVYLNVHWLVSFSFTLLTPLQTLLPREGINQFTQSHIALVLSINRLLFIYLLHSKMQIKKKSQKPYAFLTLLKSQ